MSNPFDDPNETTSHAPAGHGNINTPADNHNPHGAAQVVRSRIEAIYAAAPPHQHESEVKEEVKPSGVYNRNHRGAEAYDWRQYHAAWQQYYQQYYSQYYQAEVEKHAPAQTGGANDHSSTIAGDDQDLGINAGPTEKLKRELRENINTRAKKIRSSSHFMPIATAVCVGLAFFLLQFNKVLAAQVNSYISPSTTVSDNVIVDPNASPIVDGAPKLIIPKINVDVPVVYGLTSLDNNSTQKALEGGVAHYPVPGANSLPGQTGNNVILGHSSNDVFKPGSFKFAFVLLERMQPGDLFYIHYEGKRYVYRVSEKKVIQPNEVSTLITPRDTPVATLVTCTPIGTDDKRLLVFGDQISPDPKEAARNESAGDPGGNSAIPGNEPSLLQQLFRF